MQNKDSDFFFYRILITISISNNKFTFDTPKGWEIWTATQTPPPPPPSPSEDGLNYLKRSGDTMLRPDRVRIVGVIIYAQVHLKMELVPVHLLLMTLSQDYVLMHWYLQADVGEVDAHVEEELPPAQDCQYQDGMVSVH